MLQQHIPASLIAPPLMSHLSLSEFIRSDATFLAPKLCEAWALSSHPRCPAEVITLYWPLIGQEWSRDLDNGLSMAKMPSSREIDTKPKTELTIPQGLFTSCVGTYILALGLRSSGLSTGVSEWWVGKVIAATTFHENIPSSDAIQWFLIWLINTLETCQVNKNWA